MQIKVTVVYVPMNMTVFDGYIQPSKLERIKNIYSAKCYHVTTGRK